MEWTDAHSAQRKSRQWSPVTERQLRARHNDEQITCKGVEGPANIGVPGAYSQRSGSLLSIPSADSLCAAVRFISPTRQGRVQDSTDEGTFRMP
jgi:hypothetical protein